MLHLGYTQGVRDSVTPREAIPGYIPEYTPREAITRVIHQVTPREAITRVIHQVTHPGRLTGYIPGKRRHNEARTIGRSLGKD